MYNKKYPLYLRAFAKVLKESIASESEERTMKLKIVFYGVKTMIHQPESESYEEAMGRFQTISAIKQVISELTLNEFMNLFPIKKDFKGYKYEIKDYFSTIEYVNTLDPNEPIGENALMLLGEYWNDDINDFFVESVTSLSDLRQYEGHISMFEEFMASQGMDTPNTFKNTKGEAMYVRNGKPQAVGFKTKKLELVK